MAMTILNTEMLVVVGPVGRDIAAFTDPLRCLQFAIELDRINHATRFSYRRPDGDTKRLCDFGDTRNQAEFIAWASDWEPAS
jgi:hypothetical protein